MLKCTTPGAARQSSVTVRWSSAAVQLKRLAEAAASALPRSRSKKRLFLWKHRPSWIAEKPFPVPWSMRCPAWVMTGGNSRQAYRLIRREKRWTIKKRVSRPCSLNLSMIPTAALALWNPKRSVKAGRCYFRIAALNHRREGNSAIGKSTAWI